MTVLAPVRASLVVAVLLLGPALSACGGDVTGDTTTCGDFASMSDGERRDLIRDGVDEANDEETQKALDAASDGDLDQVSDLVVASCSGRPDDTTLNEAAGA